MSFTVDLGPCDCCPPTCEHVECSCCTSPCGLVPARYALTFADDFVIRIFGGGTQTIAAGTYTVVASGNCDWLTSPAPGATFEFRCCDGTWYFVVTQFNVPVGECPYLVFELDPFDCCEGFPQTLTMTPLSDVSGICAGFYPCSDPTDPPFVSYPSEVVVSLQDCDCPSDCCDCDCCVDGYWTEYTMTVAGITDVCTGCTRLNGSWTLTKVTGCGWETGTPDPGFCTGAGPYWTLACVGGTWFLGSHIDGPMYQTSTDLCVDGGTIPLTGSSVLCNNYPATLTVTPSGIFVPCP